MLLYDIQQSTFLFLGSKVTLFWQWEWYGCAVEQHLRIEVQIHPTIVAGKRGIVGFVSTLLDYGDERSWYEEEVKAGLPSGVSQWIIQFVVFLSHIWWHSATICSIGVMFQPSWPLKSPPRMIAWPSWWRSEMKECKSCWNACHGVFLSLFCVMAIVSSIARCWLEAIVIPPAYCKVGW